MATLVALLGAMFVAMGSVSAAETIKLSLVGGASDARYIESDNVVKAGSNYSIIGESTVDTTPTWNAANSFLVGDSGLIVRAAVDPSIAAKGAGSATQGQVLGTLIVPSSTSAGDYLVYAKVGTETGELKVTVGEPGVGAGSAELSLDSFHLDGKTGTEVGTFTCGPASGGTTTGDAIHVKEKESEQTDTASSGAGIAATDTGVCLIVNVKNTMGNKPNVPEVTRVTFITPGAATDSSSYATTASGSVNAFGDADGGVSQRHTVRKEKPGTIDVYAIVFGAGGAVATSNTLTLTFTGDATSILVEDAATTLHYSTVADAKGDDDGDDNTEDSSADDNARDPNGTDTTDPPTIRLQVTATDGSGNTATVPTTGYSSTIKNADGDTVLSNKISVPSTAVVDGGQTYLVITGHGTEAAKLAPGTYTIEVTNGTRKDSAMFVVSGGAGMISLEVDSETVEVGQVVKVTAEVSDADGNAVIDNTEVTFEVAGALDLKLLGATNGMVTGKTKAGSASARALVSKGTGSASFVVSVGSIYETITVSTMAEEEEAMPEEEASVSCLSELSGFATWSCGVSADASEIFAMVSARGVSAIHLWNGSTWVRYSVVDDAMVPGSSDFMVTENDILYISN